MSKADQSDHEAPRDSRPEKRRRKIGWEAISAVAGVVGVLVTVLFACAGPSGAPVPPDTIPAASSSPGLASASPSSSPSGGPPAAGGDTTQQGACNIDDSDVQVGGDMNCAQPPSLVGIDTSYGSVFSALYAGPDARPPAPTTFEGYDDSPFCHRWSGWVDKAPDIYLVNPVVSLDVESGSHELEVVKDVRVVIFDKTPIASRQPPKVVNCQVGGGSNPGNIIEVDTRKPATTLAKGEEGNPGVYGPPAPMPPANLTSENLEYEGAVINISSEDGYYYTGRLEIVTRANGQAKTVTVGDRTQPLRWVTDRESRFHPASVERFFAWKTGTSEWIEGDDIYAPVG